jgi:hypothetical protein
MVYRRVFKLTDEEHDQFYQGSEDYIEVNVEGFNFKGPNGMDLGHYDKTNMTALMNMA